MAVELNGQTSSQRTYSTLYKAGKCFSELHESSLKNSKINSAAVEVGRQVLKEKICGSS